MSMRVRVLCARCAAGGALPRELREERGEVLGGLVGAEAQELHFLRAPVMHGHARSCTVLRIARQAHSVGDLSC